MLKLLYSFDMMVISAVSILINSIHSFDMMVIFGVLPFPRINKIVIPIYI